MSRTLEERLEQQRIQMVIVLLLLEGLALVGLNTFIPEQLKVAAAVLLILTGLMLAGLSAPQPVRVRALSWLLSWRLLLVLVLAFVGLTAFLGFGEDSSLSSASVFLVSGWLEAGLVVAVAVVLIRFGLVAVGVGVGRSLKNGLGASLAAAVRGLAVVFMIMLAVFVTDDGWRFLARGEAWRFWCLFGLIVAVTLGFVGHGLFGLGRKLCRLKEPPEPLESLARRGGGELLVDRPLPSPASICERLEFAERLNVYTVLFAAVLVRLALLGFLTTALFVVLGVVRFDTAATAALLEDDQPHEMMQLGSLVLTTELLRISALLGALAALSFAATAVVDEKLRDRFAEDQVKRLWEAMATWAYYRGILEPSTQHEPAQPDGSPGLAQLPRRVVTTEAGFALLRSRPRG